MEGQRPVYSLNESLAFLVNRTGSAMSSAFSQELRSLDLTVPMFRVLAGLWTSGEQSLNGLADLTCVELSTLSRQVAALSKQKLVMRTKSQLDSRSINIRLTERGRHMVERLLPAVERHERAAFAGISAMDARRLRQLLNRVYANIVSSDEVMIVADERQDTELD